MKDTMDMDDVKIQRILIAHSRTPPRARMRSLKSTVDDSATVQLSRTTATDGSVEIQQSLSGPSTLVEAEDKFKFNASDLSKLAIDVLQISLDSTIGAEHSKFGSHQS